LSGRPDPPTHSPTTHTNTAGQIDKFGTYEIVNGNYSIDRDLFFYIDDMGLTGHESKLFKRRFRLDVRKFVFINTVMNSWNSLPA